MSCARSRWPINAVEGRQMLDASRRAGKRLMINFSFRFAAQSQALKAQVEAGVFGDFYFGRSAWHPPPWHA